MSRFGVVPTYWMRHLELSATDKATLALLSTYADENGYCWPSVPVLAMCLTISDRHIQRSLRRLEEVGAVRIKRRYNEDGKPVSNGYWIRGYENKPQTVYMHERTGVGDADVTYEGDTEVTNKVTPVSPKQYQVEQDQVEQATTTSSKRGKGRLDFPAEPMQEVYLTFWRMAPNRAAFDASLQALLDGLTTGKPCSLDELGAALLDLAGNGEGFNLARVRGYLRKAQQAKTAGSAAGTANRPGILRWTLTDEERETMVREYEAEMAAQAQPKHLIGGAR